MNLALALESYFGRLSDETVPAIKYRDASSYERLQATWADDRPLPDEATLNTHWQNEGMAELEAWEAGRVLSENDMLLAEITAQLMDTQDALALVTALVLDMADFNNMAE